MKLIPQAAAFALLSVSVFAADTALLTLAPASAKVIGGIHVDRTRNSQFGQFVLAQMNSSDSNFQEFVSATGFDPRRDLLEVVFASSEAGKNAPSLVMARGIFNGPQIFAAIKAKAESGAVTKYRGVDILDLKNGNASLAFVDGSLALAGDPGMLRAALDRRAGAGTASALTAKATTASGKYDAWMVTNGVFVAPLPNSGSGNGPQVPNLQGILETSGGLTFGSIIRFNGEALTRSDKDAQGLADVVRFLASMIQMNGGNNPEMQIVQSLFTSLDVKAEASTVKLSFSLPEADLEKLMQQTKTRRPAAAASNRR